jgi:hypothetical protein
VTTPRIAVVHHARSLFPLDLFQRVRGVADVIWVLDDGFVDDPTTSRLLRRIGTVVDIAGLDDDAAAQRLGEASPDGILSFVDDQIPRAAQLARRLHLRYHTPELAHILTDKGAQREALARGGVDQPWFAVVRSGTSSAALAELGARTPFPVVVKPVTGMGSRGIHLIEDANQLKELTNAPHDTVIEELLLDRNDHPSWMASYLSAEVLVTDGIAHHIALTGRFPLASPFRETGNFIPAATDDLSSEQVWALTDAVVRTLDVRDSFLHIEIKLTPDGPRLIEVNGRLGGRPGFVLSEVSDLNLHAIACLAAAGIQIDIEDVAPLRGVGFWLMFQPPVEATVLTVLDGLEAAATLPGVRMIDPRRTVGQQVDWREGTDGQVLTIRGAVEDHAALRELVRTLGSTIRLDYTTA